ASVLTPLQKANAPTPAASAKLIAQRDEVLSRALADANAAQAGESATASLSTDDTILGKYKIVRRLSAGGMAEVFLAKQVGIGGFEKPVALKLIQRQLLETRHLAIDMFLNEAKIAGRLTHPNIVQVLDVGEVGGALYLAMEYVRGRDLRDVVKKLRASRAMMPLGDACYVVREVAQALHHAYWSTDMAGKRLAVVHRVKLLDFGVAMSSVTEQTETMIVGKWLYMSPEHTKNQQIDHRSDLFSLGVILYLLCTGKMPFGGTTPKEIVRKIRSGLYKPLQECAPDIPEGLAVLVGRMLAPDPEDRPQSGREVVAALTEVTRSYGIESSAANVASFIAQLFPDERRESAIMEIVRAPGPSEEIESFATDAAATKVGVGSGPKQVQPSVLDDRSPSGLSPSPLSPSPLMPGSGSTPHHLHTSSSGFVSADISTSYPRRSTHDVITASKSKQEIAPRLPNAGTSAWEIRRLLIVITIVLLAIATYLLVRPR
ncbi:MAG: serine/threonine protein kinase, partial [Deltaproteobacteria bacterium]